MILFLLPYYSEISSTLYVDVEQHPILILLFLQMAGCRIFTHHEQYYLIAEIIDRKIEMFIDNYWCNKY